MTKGEVDIITMGCSKNLVDSEALTRLIAARGWRCVHDPERPQGEYVIVNTCGFIQDAKRESIETILALVGMRDEGQIGKVIVMGCLSQRYLNDLEQAIPEVDAYYGKFDFRKIAGILPDISEPGKVKRPRRLRRTPKHYAYVKISEGCDRRCAFCAIPIITGPHRSRPMDEILSEVRAMAREGVREIQVVAQELTYYGVDLDGKRHIAGLVSGMADIPGIKWIRLHYAYPNQFPLELLDVMRERENVCRYIDIAFQHASDRVLEAMQRHFTKKETMDLIEEMRRRVPGIHIRTTLMTGFPGETEEDFKELLDFVRWARFERMGAFIYSEEEGTYAAKHFRDDVPEEVKRRRLDELMTLQQEISAETAEKKVGQVMPVIIDRGEGDFYVGRTEFSSPEVDPEVLLPAPPNGKRLKKGRIYDTKIVGSNEFDLYGQAVSRGK